jgi:NAD(P)-dependent dehydrogenase (short-subunit alcohol dehydrogenase family)
MDLGLTGQVALVTGASMGIGEATARMLATEGCDVVLVARTAERLDAVAQSITAETGRRAFTFPADLSESAEVDRLAAKWSNVNILVNNAGAIPGGHIDKVDEHAWRAGWELKVFGYVNLTRRIYAAMKARGAGVIVNVIGTGDQILDPSYICGAAGNASLTAFTRSLGSDSHRDGIRVVGVSPGPVATERLKRLSQTTTAGASRPFGRPATPEEIASAVAFLASPRSAYTSGAVLIIDGGQSAWTRG